MKKKKLGMSGKKTAAIITNDLELPLTADEYYSQVMELSAERLQDAKLMPGIGLQKFLEVRFSTPWF